MRTPVPALRISPVMARATRSAPITGLRAALTLPPPSAIQLASGASIAISASTSPLAAVCRNCAVISALRCGSIGSRAAPPHLRRARTCSRARCAIWRTVTVGLPTASAISP
jgi:hypothetical protein